MVRIFATPSEGYLWTTGVVVQLVRIHACHAWGRGFESRPFRQKPFEKSEGFFCGLKNNIYPLGVFSKFEATICKNRFSTSTVDILASQ